MTRIPSFAEFYSAVHGGREPFPWQSRLAQKVVTDGWPAEIGVQTGLGKTATIDIAVWSLASQASTEAGKRTVPTRIWYVVNRRLLVDAAYDHGRRLERLLSDPESAGSVDATKCLSEIAEALRRLQVGGDATAPIVVTRLRGGAEIGARPPHPAQPALLFATVPMYASSWLFRGYASSPNMRPIDAAHAGVDALVLLDEAHLARPLQRLMITAAQCDAGDPDRLGISVQRQRPTTVSLTATGDATDSFGLNKDDVEHPVIRRRLDAVKPVRVVEAREKADRISSVLADALVQELADRGVDATAVVFTNTPSTALDVMTRLQKQQQHASSVIADADIRLLTGRMRRREAELVRDALLNTSTGASASRDRTASRSSPLVVVATQTLEVGADLDFDVLVTESCGTRALIQRLGRLNRLGLCDNPSGVVVHPSGPPSRPVYGEEPLRVVERILAASDENQVANMSPRVVSDVLGAPQDEPQRVGELLPAHLWEWSKTTTAPSGEAPVELFFSGFDDTVHRVSLCWRNAQLSEDSSVVPPVIADETIQVPLSEARMELQTLLEAGEVMRLRADKVTVEPVGAAGLKPGDTLVLAPEHGRYDEYGWNPSATDEVLDVSLPRWPGIPIDADALRPWVEPTPQLDRLSSLLDAADNDEREWSDVILDVAEILRGLEPRSEHGPQHVAEWTAMIDSLEPRVEWVGTYRVMATAVSDGPRRRRTIPVAADLFDDLSADSTSVSLVDHGETVGEIAGKLARMIGLPDHLVRTLELAGRFHDVGKADPRFQRWLDPRGAADGLVAKSACSRTQWRADREASGWPAGGRHEEISRRIVQQWIEGTTDSTIDTELLIHLVVSHHGYGRPVLPEVADTGVTEVAFVLDDVDVSVPGTLSETDWEQPRRFRQCCENYGYWGLAFLESLLRQADHVASSWSEVA